MSGTNGLVSSSVKKKRFLTLTPEDSRRTEADPDGPEQVLDVHRIPHDLEEGEQRAGHPHPIKEFPVFREA